MINMNKQIKQQLFYPFKGYIFAFSPLNFFIFHFSLLTSHSKLKPKPTWNHNYSDAFNDTAGIKPLNFMTIHGKLS